TDRWMRNSHAGPDAVRSASTTGALPVSARLLQAKARGRRAGPKNRPFRQREIAAYPSSPSDDSTPKRRATIRRRSVDAVLGEELVFPASALMPQIGRPGDRAG